MSAFALLLILLAALCHASWNLLLKQAVGGPAFLWLVTILSTLIYAPFAFGAYLLQQPHIGWLALGFIAGTAVLHVVYFLLLAKGYQYGDLSLVYPLARGTGPLIAIVAAMLILGERPSPVGVAGALLVALGVVLLTGAVFHPRRWHPHRWPGLVDPRRWGKLRPSGAVLFAMLTGSSIAAYSVWDKYAVATLLIPPLIFDWGANALRAVLLLPLARRDDRSARDVWREQGRQVIGVAVLSPLAYILVLTAMVFTPVSYVAPAREISILFAALMGRHFLAEGDSRRRIVAATVMVLGLAALAFG